MNSVKEGSDVKSAALEKPESVHECRTTFTFTRH